jgi:hypothetical protein
MTTTTCWMYDPEPVRFERNMPAADGESPGSDVPAQPLTARVAEKATAAETPRMRTVFGESQAESWLRAVLKWGLGCYEQ